MNEIAKIEKEVPAAKATALRLVVADQEGLDRASNGLKIIKELMDPLKEAEQIIEKKVDDYMAQEGINRKEEAAKAEAKAQRERDAKLKRINADIEKLAETAGDHKTALTVLEEKLDQCSNEDEAVNLMAAIETKQAQLDATKERAEAQTAEGAMVKATPVATAPREKPKAKGMSSSVKKVGEVVNTKLLIRAVADGRAPEGIIKFDEGAINKILNTGMALPGVKIHW
jgi:hypothetical protein